MDKNDSEKEREGDNKWKRRVAVATKWSKKKRDSFDHKMRWASATEMEKTWSSEYSSKSYEIGWFSYDEVQSLR